MTTTYVSHIDSPAADDAVDTPFVELSGWVASEDGPIEALEAVVGERRYRPTPVSRPDLADRFADSSVVGFRQFVAPSDLVGDVPVEIAFVIDGESHAFPVPVAVEEAAAARFARDKREKLERVRDILECPTCGSRWLRVREGALRCRWCRTRYRYDGRVFDFLTDDFRSAGAISSTENVSANLYDDTARDIIDGHRGGLVLDDGSGLRSEYHANVVNLEIVDYPTTDVLGIGQRLPFRDDVFDAVLSIAVLEHVRDPFRCAQEMLRVLKPGGTLLCAVPFLQPFHGYPNHYYNMTSSGIRNLFGDAVDVDVVGVPPASLPVWALHWIITSYVAGLPSDVAERFRTMTLEEFLQSPWDLLPHDFVQKLSPEATEELASGFCLVGRKRS